MLKHRGRRGSGKAGRAVVRMSGVGLQLVAVVRGTGEIQGKYDGTGKREESHGEPATSSMGRPKGMDRLKVTSRPGSSMKYLNRLR